MYFVFLGPSKVSEPIYENVPLPWVSSDKNKNSVQKVELRSSDPNLQVSSELKIHSPVQNANISKSSVETNNNYSNSNQHVAHITTVPNVEQMIPHSSSVNPPVVNTSTSQLNQSIQSQSVSANSSQMLHQSIDSNKTMSDHSLVNVSTGKTSENLISTYFLGVFYLCTVFTRM